MLSDNNHHTTPEITEQKQLLKAIRQGFSVVLALTLIFGGVGLYQIHGVNASMSKIVTVNNTKIALASAMRDAIRLRTLSINKMLTTDDFFKRNEEILRFYDYARMYREAREQLLSMDMDEQERFIMDELSYHAQISQPKIRSAAELLLEEELPKDFQHLFAEASSMQDELLLLLDESIELQKNYANSALEAANKKIEYTILTLLSVLVALLIIGSLISRVVLAYVGDKNRDLARKNTQLHEARKKADLATRAKSEFLASMSHEIRTPLTSIVGFSETLMEPETREQDRRRAVESIHNSSKHLYDILNDVLDISKIEAGKLEIESISVSPVGLVQEVVRIVENKASNQGLSIVTEFEFPLPKEIYSDPTRIKQILLNLCSNAVKFTESGTITIRASYNEQVGEMVFSVTDTGIGMTKEQIDKVFQPFEQADKSTTRYFGGTGLGLSISKQLAELLGGSLVCASELGSGTTFTLTLQSKIASPGQWINELDALGDSNTYSTTQRHVPQLLGRVLLAEDSPDIQKLITMYLQKAGLRVVVVDNGADVVHQARQGQFDLVLMDMQMPVMNGIVATGQLRRQGFTNPIISLTANATKGDKDRCLKAGANDYLTKPVDVDLFYRTLQKYLSEGNKGKPGVREQPVKSLRESSLDKKQPATQIDADEELQALRQGFVNRLPDAVGEITTYYHEKNWQDLLTSSHKLKGAGGAFGYPELSEISKQIMECVNQQSDNGLMELIDKLNERSRQISKKAG